MLKSHLGKLHRVYVKLVATMESERFEASPEWRFYKDGGAWLCKITRKKKTLFWLSAWKTHLNAGFYFTEKTGKGIADLNIKKKYKAAYQESSPIGKLKPLTIELSAEAHLKDLFTVAEYKISQ